MDLQYMSFVGPAYHTDVHLDGDMKNLEVKEGRSSGKEHSTFIRNELILQVIYRGK